MGDEYKGYIEQMIWSYSRLKSFEHCKYSFYLKYIVNDSNKYLPESNYYAEVGIFVHDILAKIFKGELSVENAPEYFVNEFDNNVFYKAKESIMEKTFDTCADYFANLDISALKDYNILGVEMEVPIKINDYSFTGFIDLLLENKTTKELIIVDHKSSSYPFKKNGDISAKCKESFGSYKKQMYLYSYAVKETFGKYPTRICWNHFKDQRVAVIPFDMNDYNDTLRWSIDTVKKIEIESEYEPNLNFFYCTNICEFRNCCEYKKYLSEVS